MGSTYNPLMALGYTAGTILIAGVNIGVPVFLLDLIKAQLEPNCPGAALLVLISSDTDNVYVGASSKLGGALSASNYGYLLTSGGSSYRSSAGAGNSAPIADLQLFCVGAATLHVEIYG
jgi:hypothetical protein